MEYRDKNRFIQGFVYSVGYTNEAHNEKVIIGTNSQFFNAFFLSSFTGSIFTSFCELEIIYYGK